MFCLIRRYSALSIEKKKEDCWLLLHLTTNVFSLLELKSVRTHFSRHVDNDMIMDGKKTQQDDKNFDVFRTKRLHL